MNLHPRPRPRLRLLLSFAALLGTLACVSPLLDAADEKEVVKLPDLKPGSLEGRREVLRPLLLKASGGNAASEEAVAEGLKWLSRHQFTDGHWGLHDFAKAGRCTCGNSGVAGHDMVGTAFALLPFLAVGETHEAKDKKYTKLVDRGLKWMCNHMGADGQLGDGYTQAIATIVLCEAYEMTVDANLRPFAQRAVNKIVDWQGPDGGFRYSPKTPGDMSVSGWHMQALAAARRAGLNVPDATIKAAYGFLDKVSADGGATYGYTSGQERAGYRMSAVGLLAHQSLGWKPGENALVKGVTLMQKLPPGPNPRDIYYFHHATEVMHHMSAVMPDEWTRWHVPMRDLLVKWQDQGAKTDKRDQKGSWDPTGDALGPQLGRLGYTSLCLLTLEVYYREVPLYPREEKKD